MRDEQTSPWFIYMIRADDGSYYTGITTDLARRWREHVSLKSGAKYFRGRRPEALVYVETCADRSAASRREAAIKQLARAAKQALLGAADNVLAGPGGAAITAALAVQKAEV